MNRPVAKGWCPGALHPMMSGDGLLVRVRPRLGRLTAEQIEALCTSANAHGSGVIDLTSRGNIQIRGVSEHTYGQLLVELEAAHLIDQSAVDEERNNILTSPLWQTGDDTERVATELGARLCELPDLPSKFGFAIDASGLPMLSAASADIRVERGVSGELIVRLDGVAVGEKIPLGRVVDRVIALCHWFVETGGARLKRMGRHVSKHPFAGETVLEAPATAASQLVPGPSSLGPAYGTPFGSMTATNLTTIVRSSGANALRTTPWRLFVLEGGRAVESDTFIADPSDPLLDIAACPGAPYCLSSTVDTRQLARDIASTVTGALHVSGCTKGCAHPSSAPIALVGRGGRFDMVRDGCAWDLPEETGLSPAEVRARLGRV